MQISWMSLLRALPFLLVAFLVWFFFVRNDAVDTAPDYDNVGVVSQPVKGTQTSPASGEDIEAASTLIKQLQLAEAMNRRDLIDNALARLRAITPNSPIVQFYSAYQFIADENIDEARAILQGMQKNYSGHKQTLYLQQYLQAMTEGKDQLSRAQLLATAGRHQDALDMFKELFPDGMPTLGLQLRKLEIRGRISENWTEVRASLEALNHQYERFPLIEIMFAEHLRRRNSQDSQAAEILQRLAIGAGLGQRAAASWLQMLDARPISQLLVQDYADLASRYPNDIHIQDSYRHAVERLETEREQLKDPYYRARKLGLAALDANRNQEAKTRLEYALKGRPDDEQVLGGLGLLHLRLGNSERAEYYFELALRHNQNPDWVGKWTGLIETARYWVLVKKVKLLTEQGRYTDAESALTKLQALRPDSARLYTLKATLAGKKGQFMLAESAYQRALHLSPLDGAALHGLLSLREQRHGRRAALQFAGQLSAAQQQVLRQQINTLKQELAAAQVELAMQSGDPDRALAAVEQALLLQPTSPWQRSDLAKMLVKLGQAQRADQLMADWRRTSPTAEMIFAYALYLSSREQERAALSQLQSIPASQRSDAMQQNLLRLELNQAFAGLDIDSPNAQANLNALSRRYQGDLDAQIRLAKAWIELEQMPRAIKIAQDLKPTRDWPVNRQLSYGNLLLSLNQIRDFSSWYAGLNLSDLAAAEQREFAELNTRFQLKKAVQAEEEGKHILAYSLYHRAAQSLGPYQNEASLGILRSSAAINEDDVYQQQAASLLSNSAMLSPKELIQLLSVFSDNQDRKAERQLIAKIRQRDDISAMQMREIMLLSAEQGQSALTEELAYDVLLRANGKPTNTPLRKQWQKRKLYQSGVDNWLTRSARQQIDKLRARNDGHVIVGVDFKKRDGRDQTSQVPIEVKWPVPSLDGHIIARADFVSVDSGNINYLDPVAGGINRIPFKGSAEGVALGIGWLSERWWADIGTTPVGFQNSSVVGGIGMNGKLSQVGWSLALSRRPEIGTTLSYAGLEVPAGASNAGTEWGGVIRSGAKLGLSYDRGGANGYWASIQYHGMTGEHVADNTRFGLLGGVYHRLLDQDDRQFRIGLNVLHFQYDKNLSEFTLQHGAYFSPQNYLSLSIPVRYYGRSESEWSYLIGASISNSWSSEDAPYQLGGRSSSGGGFGYALEAAVEKRVSDRWYLGVAADVQRADFYEPNHIIMYAKYTFSDRWQPIWTPPEPPIPYSSFD